MSDVNGSDNYVSELEASGPLLPPGYRWRIMEYYGINEWRVARTGRKMFDPAVASADTRHWRFCCRGPLGEWHGPFATGEATRNALALAIWAHKP